MELVVAFDGGDLPALASVGGKGYSLIRMTRADVAVPPGFVLTVAFFAPWFAALADTDEYARFVAARGDDDLKTLGDALKARCPALVVTPAQRDALARALRALPDDRLFAVRSSSPEEDLDGSSFAGGYETVLGVTPETLDDAVRRAFASCLDARVAIYKRAHGFDASRPRIAVVVQRQVASEVAGVGFSVDPISNDHDVAVFDANWGLGETVVAGQASPDLYTVDKVRRVVTGCAVGKKETSVWLRPDGGTVERPDPRHGERTLTDPQVLALTDQLVAIETLYGKPMDIEWAFAGGALYLLQARPITTHLELPAELVTAPGAPRKLYWDVSIAVQGLFDPLTPMGTDAVAAMIRAASVSVLGRDIAADLERSPIAIRHGRMLVNLSNILAFVSREKVMDLLPAIDPVSHAALGALRWEDYPPGPGLAGVPWHALLGAPATLAAVLDASFLPEHARGGVERACSRLDQHLRAAATRALPFDAFVDDVVGTTARTMFHDILPAFVSAKLALGRLRGLFEAPTDAQRAQLARLDQSLPGNVTVEMGLALAHLAQLVPPGATVASLLAGLATGTLPADFAGSWADFLARYGHRGVRELDVAAPRYREQPQVLLQQVVQLAGADPARGPQAVYDRSQRERHAAFEALGEVAHARGWLPARRFQSLYRVVETLCGLRETPKFWLIRAIDVLRARALREGAVLAAAGRLDRAEQVFDLVAADVAAADRDPTLDLRARAAERRAVPDRLARYKQLPRLFDSRGRILRAPAPPPRPGELVGHPVSPGVVRGPVKVLREPDEKPLLAGEVLVTRATDPGWTPLFVNAAAVVLEVGGVMQHGALVAREYGKPCVVGIEAVMDKLRDGQWVEVDGAAGVVRLVEPPA